MFCTFIFAVLLLKNCFPTGDSYKDIVLQIFSYGSQADYNCYRVIAIFVPNFVAMATEVGGRKCDWQHSMAHHRKSPYRRKNLADISYTPSFVPNFVPWQRVSIGKKCSLQHSMAHPRNPAPHRCKNFLHKPNYSQFRPKLRCHGNGGWSGENAIVSIRWPIPENPL